ncbi:MAG: hypothetical protein ACK559_36035, partial [bacterium]
MHGAAVQPGPVEEVVQRDRQQLGDAGGGGVPQAGAAGRPREADEAVAELVGRPLRAVRGVEAGDAAVEAEAAELGLGQHAVAPAPVGVPGVGAEVRAIAELPGLGQRQVA